MILLALTKTERIRGQSSINTQRTTIIFIPLLPPTTLLPRGEHLFQLPLIDILEIFKDFSSTIRKYSKTSHQHPRIFKDLFACKIVLAFPSSKQQSSSKPYSSRNQQSSSNQQQQPAAATSSSNQQQQPATAINSSNHQQQPATAINSSNQQQQPAAATSNSDQQQQPAAAVNSSNQHRPTCSTYTINAGIYFPASTAVIVDVDRI